MTIKHKPFWTWLLSALTLLLLVGITVTATAQIPTATVTAPTEIYFFHSYTCPHCEKQKPLMEEIDTQYEDIKVHIVEIHQQSDQWQDFREQQSLTSGAVPRTQVGDRSFIGYSETDGPLEYIEPHQGYVGYRNQIIQAIADASGHDLKLAIAPTATAHVGGGGVFPWWILGLPVLYGASYGVLRKRLQQPAQQRYWLGGLGAIAILSIFLAISSVPDTTIRTVAEQLPFPLFVGIIALVDGFNPCAFTVLIILLSLLTHTKRRRDMAVVGGTFILTSAVMYFLFILVMISLGSVLFEQYSRTFLLLLGLGVILAGMINLKDYIWFKRGISLSLSAQDQKSVTQKASRIVRQLNLSDHRRVQYAAVITSTITLGIFVNLIELGCTAILPVVYMASLVNVCATEPYPFLCYSAWTALYALIYIIPLGLILVNFMYSFRSTRLSEQQGRQLKLMSGLFMVLCGLVMLFRPELLLSS